VIKLNWEERAKYVRDKEKIPAEVSDRVISYCTQGYFDSDTRIKLIKIDDLKNYSTACGRFDNKCFDKTIRQFLKESSDLDYVVAEVWDDEERETPLIQNLAVKYKDTFTELQYLALTNYFSTFIDYNDGSLRCEESTSDGKWWDCYESE